MVELQNLNDLPIRVYFVNDYKKELIKLPNIEHLYRRISFDLEYIRENDSEGFMEFKVRKPTNRFKESINYLRAYCKARSMFVSKLMILRNPTHIFESMLKEIDNESESVYQEDNYPILHFKSHNLIESSD